MVGDAGLEALYGCQIHIVGVGNGHAIHSEVIGERLEEVSRLLLLEFYRPYAIIVFRHRQGLVEDLGTERYLLGILSLETEDDTIFLVIG